MKKRGRPRKKKTPSVSPRSSSPESQIEGLEGIDLEGAFLGSIEEKRTDIFQSSSDPYLGVQASFSSIPLYSSENKTTSLFGSNTSNTLNSSTERVKSNEESFPTESILSELLQILSKERLREEKLLTKIEKASNSKDGISVDSFLKNWDLDSLFQLRQHFLQLYSAAVTMNKILKTQLKNSENNSNFLIKFKKRPRGSVPLPDGDIANTSNKNIPPNLFQVDETNSELFQTDINFSARKKKEIDKTIPIYNASGNIVKNEQLSDESLEEMEDEVDDQVEEDEEGRENTSITSTSSIPFSISSSLSKNPIIDNLNTTVNNKTTIKIEGNETNIKFEEGTDEDDEMIEGGILSSDPSLPLSTLSSLSSPSSSSTCNQVKSEPDESSPITLRSKSSSGWKSQTNQKPSKFVPRSLSKSSTSNVSKILRSRTSKQQHQQHQQTLRTRSSQMKAKPSHQRTKNQPSGVTPHTSGGPSSSSSANQSGGPISNISSNSSNGFDSNILQKGGNAPITSQTYWQNLENYLRPISKQDLDLLAVTDIINDPIFDLPYIPTAPDRDITTQYNKETNVPPLLSRLLSAFIEPSDNQNTKMEHISSKSEFSTQRNINESDERSDSIQHNNNNNQHPSTSCNFDKFKVPIYMSPIPGYSYDQSLLIENNLRAQLSSLAILTSTESLPSSNKNRERNRFGTGSNNFKIKSEPIDPTHTDTSDLGFGITDSHERQNGYPNKNTSEYEEENDEILTAIKNLQDALRDQITVNNQHKQQILIAAQKEMERHQTLSSDMSRCDSLEKQILRLKPKKKRKTVPPPKSSSVSSSNLVINQSTEPES